MSQSHTTIVDPRGNRFDRSKRAKRALVRAICASAVAVVCLGGVAEAFTPVPIPKPRSSGVSVVSPASDQGSVAAR